MNKSCEHLANVPIDPIEGYECVECVPLGETWVHLRYCVDCKLIRCCDNSKNQHASKHAASSEHVVIRSAEPGETWAWCYTHSQMADL
jgi:hypothetical protein